MIDSTLIERRRETITRQAKRLVELLNLPQTIAKSVLARALYRCDGEADLMARISQPTTDRHIELLAELPRSEQACAYFETIRKELARAVSQHLLTNSNLPRLVDLIREVFAVPGEPTTLGDLLPALQATSWSSAGIGPDPQAVLRAEVEIASIGISLVATRIYMPEYYNFGQDVNPEYATPYGEPLKIIWESPDAWRQAAFDYLSDEDAEDLLFPDIELTETMSNHAQWFNECLKSVGDCLRYGGGDDRLVPHIIESLGCYIIFGYPSRLAESAEHMSGRSLLPNTDEDSSDEVVLIADTPICLRWISVDPKTGTHTGEFKDFFETLKRGVLRQAKLLTSSSPSGIPGVLWLQVATDFDIRQALKVAFSPEPGKLAFVLKTNDAPLASELLARVANRDLKAFGAHENVRYAIEMNTPSGMASCSLSVSLELIGEHLSSGANLVLTTVSKVLGQQRVLLMEISPKLLTLVDKLGKKVTHNAINHGLIVHEPASFLNELDDPPSRCQRLQRLSPELVADLCEPPSWPFRFSQQKYDRDNF